MPRAFLTHGRLALPFVAAALAGMALLAALAVVESHKEADLAALRDRDPAAYLDTIRHSRGTRDYLAELRILRGFAAWSPQAPLFLIGAWAFEPTREAARRHATEDHCAEGLIFEDAHLRRFGAEGQDAEARYRITADGRIEVDSGHRILRLTPQNDGIRIDRLTLSAGFGEGAEDSARRYLTRCR